LINDTDDDGLLKIRFQKGRDSAVGDQENPLQRRGRAQIKRQYV